MTFKPILYLAIFAFACDAQAASSELANDTSKKWGEDAAANGGTSNAVKVGTTTQPRPSPPMIPVQPRAPVVNLAPKPAKGSVPQQGKKESE